MEKIENKGSEKRLYSIIDLVEKVGGTEWYWRTQIWAGRLPFVKVGTKKLVDIKDIDLFISKNKQKETN